MKKITLALTVIALVAIGFISSCKKDKKDDGAPVSSAYSNPNDNTTTAVVSNIPRIEFGTSKSPILKLYLSITDQLGAPIKNFNSYNFKVEQSIDSKPFAVVSNFTLTTLQQQTWQW